MDVQVIYVAGKQFDAIARGHRIISDQPFPSGQDRGMTPPELMLSAIGSCAAYYAVEYLRARNLPTDGLDVRVNGAKGGKPVRLTEIGITVHLPSLSEDRREGLLRAVHTC